MAAKSISAPQQFKQPSRKGKKAWRKNVDLTQVEEGLENVRDEVIKGGVIAEKPSSELFTLDTAGNDAAQRAYNKHNKPLRADEILTARSAIPAVDTRKRASSKVTDGVLAPRSKRFRSGGISGKELNRLRTFAYTSGDSERSRILQHDEEAKQDPWAAQDLSEQFSFLDRPKPIREPKTLKRAPVSLSANGKDVPAVQKPKPATSYNPQSTEYFEALIREGEKEVKAEKKQREEEEAAKEKELRFQRERETVEEYERRVNNDEGDDDDDGSEWEGIVSDREPEPERPKAKVQRKKTKSERNKIARRKEAERQRAAELAMKKRSRQAAQIRQIVKALDAQERRSKSDGRGRANGADGQADDDAASALSSDNEEVAVRKKRFGKAPILAETLDLVLPDDLRDSLRALKPEGNLLRDRFRSMLLRGKVESRRRVSRQKRRRVKWTEKWSYKDWKLV